MTNNLDGISQDISLIKEATDRFIVNIGKVIIGKQEAIELILVALLC